jgi:hypothetical protein
LGCLAGSAGVGGLKAYLTSAQAYALISSPTAISMMTGVFHFMAISLDLLSWATYVRGGAVSTRSPAQVVRRPELADSEHRYDKNKIA